MSSPIVPRATYRLQLHAGFTLDDARRILPYLAALGVSHAYCSPYLRARPRSTHGYDIVDHNALNPEVGDAGALGAFVAALRRRGMGQILDFVPNHMGIAQADNAWWLDVLEWGEASPFARFFDIDWDPAKPELRGKVLLPFLGDHYGRVLERGELRLAFDALQGTLSVWYHGHRFPIAPRHYAGILGAPERRVGLGAAGQRMLAQLAARLRALRVPDGPSALAAPVRARAQAIQAALGRAARADPTVRAWIAARVARLNGVAGRPASFKRLHRLLEAQAYRLAYWRVAADEINYRRFFDVNELAGLCVERPEVFARVHDLLFRLIEAGKVDGLRIDHVDGLSDPRAYCARLRARVGDARWLVVEKILAPDERLRADWPVAGTTGYDFLHLVTGLLIDPEGERPLTRTYARFVGETIDFEDVVYSAKKLVMNFLLGSELHVLANRLDRLSETEWRWRDFTLTSLKEALKEVVACFPVYRTYVTAAGPSPADRRVIEDAVRAARRRSADPETTLFDFLEAALTTDLARDRPGPERAAVIDFVRHFQQYTAPVMAKGLEDTSFYRYHRLLALNDVGNDPRRFAVSLGTFHRANAERRKHWPHAMLATATHDTKRGEDVRARLAVLAEIPEQWAQCVRRWAVQNQRHTQRVDGRRAPSANDEYLLYQTLVGSWPAALVGQGAPGAAALAAYRARLEAYLVKAVREAKTVSSWRYPHRAYEAATIAFLGKLLGAPGRGSRFLADFVPFQARVAALGVVNSLAQTTLKLTVPGVPDLYQGSELWDFSLVDPDNRRPVDFTRRLQLLRRLGRRLGRTRPLAPRALAELLGRAADGRVKLFVLWRLLQLRRRAAALFRDGAYLPLEVTGPRAQHVCAFARVLGRERVVVLTTRLPGGLYAGGGPRLGRPVWDDTAVVCPTAVAWRDAISGRVVTAGPGPDRRTVLPVGALLADFPVAALEAYGGLARPARGTVPRRPVGSRQRAASAGRA